MPTSVAINVMATAAFKEAYLELVPHFERVSGHKIITTWASTQDIVSRVKAGEATDLAVMSANAIDALITAGKFAQGSHVNVASSWVAMAVRKGAPRPDISSGDALKRAMLAAKSIAYSTGPSGVYLIGLFQRMGIADPLASKVKQIKGEPIGAVVARGEAEIGFQQMSELMPVPGIDIVGGLSKDIEEITYFATGRHVDTKVAEAADALTAFFKAPTAHALIRAKGMEPA
jgi:molybdate transport system substrate-binding protein